MKQIPKHKKILQKKATKNYIEALKKMSGLNDHRNPLVQDAMRLAQVLTPIELAVIELNLPQELKKETYYIEALASEDLMFETCYLRCVTGAPPYTKAKEFGLSDKHIANYQKQWIEVGINPLTINKP
jgi:hypothetical protein